MEKIFFLASFIALVCSQQGPLTQDFQIWLNNNGYSSDDFVRSDLRNSGSYGGKNNPNDKVAKTPIVFIHGNSDAALYYNNESTGWTSSIKYFLSKGYNTQELYATTYGDANVNNALTRVHDCATLSRLRSFVEAVLKYTGASKISVVSYGMGVTLGRKIIQGGNVAGGNCKLGPSLISSVDTYVGLAGANYGYCVCQGMSNIDPICNQQNGFWPGDSCGLNTLICSSNPLPYPCNPDQIIYSSYLTELNDNSVKEGSYLFSAWSTNDMYRSWGRPTSLIRNSTGYKQYLNLSNVEVKDLTANDQYNMVVYHTIS